MANITWTHHYICLLDLNITFLHHYCFGFWQYRNWFTVSVSPTALDPTDFCSYKVFFYLYLIVDLDWNGFYFSKNNKPLTMSRIGCLFL